MLQKKTIKNVPNYCEFMKRMSRMGLNGVVFYAPLLHATTHTDVQRCANGGGGHWSTELWKSNNWNSRALHSGPLDFVYIQLFTILLRRRTYPQLCEQLPAVNPCPHCRSRTFLRQCGQALIWRDQWKIDVMQTRHPTGLGEYQTLGKYAGVLGLCPQRGPGSEPLVKGSGDAESFSLH